MTTPNPIDEAQQEITEAQEGQPVAPQYATTAQLESLTGEIKSLGRLVNKGLDSVRGDLTDRLDREREAEAMNQIPEEYREIMGPMVKQITALTSQVRNLQAGPGQLSGASTGDANLDAYLNNHGLTGNEPGLDLEAYWNQDIEKFYASARTINQAKVQPNGTTSTPAPTPETTPVPVPESSPSPPIDGMPAGSTGTADFDDVLDMFISGDITADERRTKIGW